MFAQGWRETYTIEWRVFFFFRKNIKYILTSLIPIVDGLFRESLVAFQPFQLLKYIVKLVCIGCCSSIFHRFTPFYNLPQPL